MQLTVQLQLYKDVLVYVRTSILCPICDPCGNKFFLSYFFYKIEVHTDIYLIVQSAKNLGISLY